MRRRAQRRMRQREKGVQTETDGGGDQLLSPPPPPPLGDSRGQHIPEPLRKLMTSFPKVRACRAMVLSRALTA